MLLLLVLVLLPLLNLQNRRGLWNSPMLFWSWHPHDTHRNTILGRWDNRWTESNQFHGHLFEGLLCALRCFRHLGYIGE